jgi:hypothetical protein
MIKHLYYWAPFGGFYHFLCKFLVVHETFSTFCVDKNLSDKFPIQNGLKQGDTLSQ